MDFDHEKIIFVLFIFHQPNKVGLLSCCLTVVFVVITTTRLCTANPTDINMIVENIITEIPNIFASCSAH